MSSYEAIAAAPVAAPHAPRPVKRSLSTRWISVLTLLTLIALWWAVTAAGLIEPLFLPPPSAVLEKGWLLATKGYMDSTLWQHLSASLSRIGLALGAAILTAIPVGIAIGRNRIARGILDPLIEFYRPIPPLAYLPLIVIWCGIGELSKVLLIYLAIFAPIAIATATGAAALRGSQSVSTMPSAAGLRPSPVARLASRTCCQTSTVSSVAVVEFQAPSMRPLPALPPVVARTAPASRLATPGSSPGMARKRSW